MADLVGVEAQRESAMEASRAFLSRLRGQFSPNRRRDIAVISNVARDAAERAKLVTATIGGSADQVVQIDHGGSYNSGDVLLVENDGTISAPSWRALRKLAAASAVPILAGEQISLPTPSALTLTVGAYQTTIGYGGSVSWVFASWEAVPDSFGAVMSYEVQHARNEFVNSPYSRLVRWSQATTAVAISVGVSDLIIPRTGSYEDDFPTSGAARIAGEIVYFSAGTGGGPYTTGITGEIDVISSTLAVVYDASQSWSTDNRWLNYCMIDSDGSVFKIVGSIGNNFSVEFGIAPPSAGSYQIFPALSGCTRGADGTTATVHAAGTGIVSLSCGALIDGLPSGVDYNVRVRAVRDDGAVSAYTAWASTTTVADSGVPDTPTDFTVVNGVNEVILSWSGPTQLTDPRVRGFQMFRSVSPSGFNPENMGSVGLSYTVRLTSYPGQTWYWAVRSLDLNWGSSEFTAWEQGTAGFSGANKLTNADFERNFTDQSKPDEWCLQESDEWTKLGSSSFQYGPYGMDGGKGVRCVLVPSGGVDNACHIYWPGLDPEKNRFIPLVADVYVTHSIYVNLSGLDENYIKWDLPGQYEGDWLYIHMFCRSHDGSSTGGGRFNVIDGETQVVWRDPSSDWVRIASRTHFTDAILNPLALGGYYYVSFHARVINELPGTVIVDLDRPQYQQGGLSDWDLGAGTYGTTFSVDPAGIASQYFKVNAQGQIAGNLVPLADGTLSAGTASSRWSAMHAATAHVDTVTSPTELSLEVDSVQGATVDASGNLRTVQALELEGDVKAYRGAALHTGYIYVPLASQATSTSFDGDSFSTVSTSTKIDLSAEFGIPANVKAVAVRVTCRDSTTWGANDYYFAIGPSSGEYNEMLVYCYGGDLMACGNGVVRCDSGGDIYYRVYASGTDTLECWIRIYGYFI